MPTPVQRISPELRDVHVPAPLRDLPLWLVWTYEQFEGEDKPRKVPFYVGRGKRYGEQGSAEDRGKLTTFAMAREDAIRRGMTGVGFAPLEGEDVIALDFDKCVVDGRVDPAVLELVQGTYAEYSPSGTGVRAFFRGASHLVGNRKSAAREGRFGVETFSSSGFVTVTGWMLDHIEMLDLDNRVAEIPQRVIDFCLERFGPQASQPVDPDDFMLGHEPPLGLTIEEMEELVDQLDPDMSRDEWIRVGMALHHETEGDDTGFYIWNEWSSFGGKYPGEEALRTQWESFERRKGQRRAQTTIATVKWMVKQAQGASGGVLSPEAAERAVEALQDAVGPSSGVCSPEGYDGKFPVWSAAALSRQPPTDWLIKGILPQADLIMLYGPSGSGKSFVAIDMAAHIALGLQWRERKTSKGRVVIIAAEGGGGYGKRLRAWCIKHNVSIDELDVGIITVPPNFMERDDVRELAASISLIEGVVLIIVDTLAQVTPGANENASDDMGTALANCRVLRRVTGAVVALVHHAGKDVAKGARGWSGARAAVDAELEVIHEEGIKTRQLRITKQKDGEDGLRFGFELEQVVTGLDDDGDEITSCAVIDASVPQAPAAEGKSKIRRYGLIEAHLIEVMTMCGGVSTMKLEEFISKAVDLLPEPEGDKRDTRRQNVTRAVDTLSKKPDAPLKREGNIVVFYE